MQRSPDWRDLPLQRFQKSASGRPLGNAITSTRARRRVGVLCAVKPPTPLDVQDYGPRSADLSNEYEHHLAEMEWGNPDGVNRPYFLDA